MPAATIRVEGPPVTVSGRSDFEIFAQGSNGERLAPPVECELVDPPKQTKLRSSKEKWTLTHPKVVTSTPHMVRIRGTFAGDANHEPLTSDFEVMVAAPLVLRVVVSAVTGVTRGTQLQGKIRGYLEECNTRVNELWQHCGVRFRIQMARPREIEGDPRWYSQDDTFNKRGCAALHKRRSDRAISVFVVGKTKSPTFTWSHNQAGYGGIIVASDAALLQGGGGKLDRGTLLAHELGHVAGGLPHVGTNTGLSPSEEDWTHSLLSAGSMNRPIKSAEAPLMDLNGGTGHVSDVEARRFYENASRLGDLNRTSANTNPNRLHDKVLRAFQHRHVAMNEQAHLLALRELMNEMSGQATGPLAETCAEAQRLVSRLLAGRVRAAETLQGCEI
ncbi:MAG: hypothetical protein ACI8PZ_003739 [Myxococcota bacterium]|jgi:hypothetical protein